MTQLLNQLDTKANVPPRGLALWQLGFRPFFLLAVFYAVIVMLLWLAVRHGLHFPGLDYYGLNLWHAHEMVFGYGLAVIAGFLLTAIKNWTGVQTAAHGQLKLLVALWLLARLVVYIPGLPVLLLAIGDVAFSILLIYFVAQPLVKVGNRRNYKMIVLVSLFATLNVLSHVMLLNQQPILANQMTTATLLVMLLLIGVMAGRVFPMFSQNGVTNRYQAKQFSWLEKLWPPVMIAFILVFSWLRFSEWGAWLLFALAALSAVLHAVRLWGWYDHQIWQKPLVWVLHVGYAFLVMGFIAIACSVIWPALYFLGLHLFTIGGLGVITLGMMSRVSLGHSGRNIHQPPKLLTVVFLLLVASVLIRFFVPLLNVMSYQASIDMAGTLWVLAYGLFFVRYLGIWLKPRVDGRPG